ncbi:MAG: MBOAT family O-acyltransferase [Bacteroidales bacterium]
MVFSSSLFLIYFLPLFLLVYFIIPYKVRNYFALLASLIFYAWGAPKFIFIVLGSVALDFYLVARIPGSKPRQRKLLAAITIGQNIAMLAWFKYANFFADNLNLLLEELGAGRFSWSYIALPIGISFFTFQKITYVVDVYRGVHTPLKKLSDYALYILMFPQLIAGPIVRFVEIADQLEDRRANETAENRISGFFRFSVGLARKVLIANPLGAVADQVFSVPGLEFGTATAWLGILAYAFQIYFDFAGYSDMAIGLGKVMGFRFPENFNFPYISRSITEFWRRWHITLGRFMRDYLYIPLGGNRVSPGRTYFNLWVVFLLSGLWHGADWHFVAWGAFHGLFLILDRWFLLKILNRAGSLTAIVFTFVISLIGWVFFRAESNAQAIEYLSRMFSYHPESDFVTLDLRFYSILAVAALFSFAGVIPAVAEFGAKVYSGNSSGLKIFIRLGLAFILFTLSLAGVISSGFNPFIYFRF